MRKWKEICSPFAVPWMNPEIIILSEVSQTGKDKYHMISLICEILENDVNELKKAIYKARQQIPNTK